jgi:antitoxin PrlF
MVIATLTSKGQITLPKEVRQHLHLDEGDRLEFVIRRDGTVHVQSVGGSFRELRGMVHQPNRAKPSDEDLDSELTRLLVDDDQRIRRGQA